MRSHRLNTFIKSNRRPAQCFQTHGAGNISQTNEALRALQRPGRPDVVERVIKLFHRDASRLLAEMRAAVGRDDPDALCQAAHTLKSMSGNVGATALAAHCREIEECARSSAAVAAASLAEVEEELSEVLMALAQERLGV